MQNNRLTPVGQTATWVAAARALESERKNPLFVDPFARTLAGEEGFTVLRHAQSMMRKQGAELLLAAVGIRTRFYDDAIQAAFASGTRQLLIIAAGLDTRAFRLPLPEDAKVWELDRREIFDLKEPMMAAMNAKPSCSRQILAVDLLDDWKPELIEAGFDPSRPAAFLAEGLLVYLEPAEGASILDRITNLSAPESWLGFDVIGKSMVSFGPLRKQQEWLASKGSPMLFSTDDPERLATQRGWTAQSAVPGEPTANYGRWPFPAFPRSMPGIPRNYYVTATKAK